MTDILSNTMNIQQIAKDKEWYLNQAFNIIDEAIEKDPDYTLADDERAELVYELMEYYATNLIG